MRSKFYLGLLAAAGLGTAIAACGSDANQGDNDTGGASSSSGTGLAPTGSTGGAGTGGDQGGGGSGGSADDGDGDFDHAGEIVIDGDGVQGDLDPVDTD